jgi:hypothetical protein
MQAVSPYHGQAFPVPIKYIKTPSSEKQKDCVNWAYREAVSI